MPKFIQFCICTAVICFFCITAEAAKDKRAATFKKFSKLEVPVTLRDNNTDKQMVLVALKNDALVMRLPGRDNGGRITVPISRFNDEDDEIRLLFRGGSEYTKAIRALNSNNLGRALHFFRRNAYPLVKFLSLPLEKCDFQNAVFHLYRSIRNSGEEDEFIYLAQQIPLDQLKPEFLELTLSYADHLVAEGKNKKALSLLTSISIKSASEEQIELLMGFASKLRELEQFEDAYRIYQHIQTADTPYTSFARLWTGYCSILQGQLSTAELFLENIEELQPSDRAYPLLKLVEGRFHYTREEYDLAMRSVAEGVAYVRANQECMPELLYFSALCYEIFEEEEIAQKIYRENTLFFGDNKWAEKSKSRLTEESLEESKKDLENT